MGWVTLITFIPTGNLVLYMVWTNEGPVGKSLFIDWHKTRGTKCQGGFKVSNNSMRRVQLWVVVSFSPYKFLPNSVGKKILISYMCLSSIVVEESNPFRCWQKDKRLHKFCIDLLHLQLHPEICHTHAGRDINGEEDKIN